MAVAFADVIGTSGLTDVTVRPGPEPGKTAGASSLTDVEDNTPLPRGTLALTTSWQDVLSLTGPGEISILIIGADPTNWNDDIDARMTIDGTLCWTETGIAGLLTDTSDDEAMALIGHISHNTTANGDVKLSFETLHFTTSFKLEAKRQGDGSVATLHYLYMYQLRA